MLTAHITFSVAWFGTVAAFLALAIGGLFGNEQSVRSSYIGMDLIAWFVIIPFCLCSLITGLIQSLCTQWGLFKHYWTVVKLILTVIATVLLLVHMKPISYLSMVASDSPLTLSHLIDLRIRLIADAGAAMFVLLAATTVSVYKPWGKIQFKLTLQRFESTTKRPWGPYLLIAFGIVILLFILLHIFEGGMHH
jgi:hypothetical protein